MHVEPYKSVNNNREDARKEIMLAMVRLTFSQTGLLDRMNAAVGIYRE